MFVQELFPKKASQPQQPKWRTPIKAKIAASIQTSFDSGIYQSIQSYPFRARQSYKIFKFRGLLKPCQLQWRESCNECYTEIVEVDRVTGQQLQMGLWGSFNLVCKPTCI